MISVWTAIFTTLVVELVLNFVLIQPLFQLVRKTIIGLLRFIFGNQVLKTAVIVIAIILVYSFGYSYYTQNRLTDELEENMSVVMDATRELSIRVRIFREQRNMYLSGFAFFHGIVLWRLTRLYDQFDAIQERAEKIAHKKDQ
mmetsp:Transcript_12220/g.20897  ORF Transcript_12220/g.20897 Transcript_12220/m.20897 type:complete len:143 (-) Transcript_12220:40-468(-)